MHRWIMSTVGPWLYLFLTVMLAATRGIGAYLVGNISQSISQLFKLQPSSHPQALDALTGRPISRKNAPRKKMLISYGPK